MNVFVAFTNHLLEKDPEIVNRKDRPVLEDVRILAANAGNSDSED
jgi:hypothetical protein